MVIGSFYGGGCRVIIPRFDIEATFKAIQKYKVTYITAAPILGYRLISFKDIKIFDTSSLTTLAIGGTPVSATQLRKMRQTLTNTDVIVGYGLTEGGFVAVFDPHRHNRELMETKLQSCGKATPGVTIKIVNSDTGALLPPYQKGEIRVKSPAVMLGYYNNAHSSHAFDEDGFLKTGDIAYYDDDNYVYIVDRIKEMFKYQSWHIVPSVIEGVLLQHTAIVEACVFGVPDELDGEIPAAWVVLTDGESASVEEITEFVTQRVSDREKLRAGVKIVKSLPKTPTGKLMRREAKSQMIKSIEEGTL